MNAWCVIAHSFADLVPPPDGASPELYSSWLNQLMFSWMTGLTLTAYRRPLKKTDMWTLNTRDLSTKLVNTWQHYWLPKMKKCLFCMQRMSPLSPHDSNTLSPLLQGGSKNNNSIN
jgi:hypothetical protein